MSQERKFYVKFVLGAYGVWILAFELVGRYAATLATNDPTSALDKMIPLIPDFIWFYECCYLFPFLPLLVVKDFHRLNITLLSIIMANVIAFIVYIAYPVALPRPDLGDSLAEVVLGLEHVSGFQPGANKMPSLHVAFGWFVYFTCRGQKVTRFAEVMIFFIAAMITLSTLFLKQHIIVDAVTGVVLAVWTWALSTYLYPFLTDTQAEPTAALRRMMKNVGIMMGYVLFFWLLLPWLLWLTGRAMEEAVPLALPGRPIIKISGILLLAAGLTFCIYIMKLLVDRGRGLPISHLPAVEFVNSGPYKYSRHPIYIGYTLAWAGFALTVGSFWMLTLSQAVLILAWTLYIYLYEEPVLLNRFGETYKIYRETTPVIPLRNLFKRRC